MMQNNNEHDRVITEPVNLQSRHEEADTLVAFHAEGNILDWARFPIMCLEKVQQAFLRKKRQTTFSRGLFRADYE